MQGPITLVSRAVTMGPGLDGSWITAQGCLWVLARVLTGRCLDEIRGTTVGGLGCSRWEVGRSRSPRSWTERGRTGQPHASEATDPDLGDGGCDGCAASTGNGGMVQKWFRQLRVDDVRTWYVFVQHGCAATRTKCRAAHPINGSMRMQVCSWWRLRPTNRAKQRLTTDRRRAPRRNGSGWFSGELTIVEVSGPCWTGSHSAKCGPRTKKGTTGSGLGALAL